MSRLRAARQVLATLRTSGPAWTAAMVMERAGVSATARWPDQRHSHAALAAQVEALLRAWGAPEEHLGVTVEHLLYADLHGIDSHGVGMLIHYYRGIKAGAIQPAPRIEIMRDEDATALIDGGGGLGHVPADTAMKLAVEKCRRWGVATVAVRNSGHFGAAGAYAALAAGAGCIGIATTGTTRPSVVPTLGRKSMLGTNPIAFAAPAARNRPFLLDMATSTVALGKLWTTWRAGKAAPIGWALNEDGNPLTEARAAAEGRRLTPLGGSREQGSHKGYGLGAMVEILSSALPGVSRDHQRGATENEEAGHFFLAIDPRRFRAAGEFEADVDQLLDALRATPPMSAVEPVQTAGDAEYAAAADRAANGIPVSRIVIEDIRMVCRESGAPFLLDAS